MLVVLFSGSKDYPKTSMDIEHLFFLPSLRGNKSRRTPKFDLFTYFVPNLQKLKLRKEDDSYDWGSNLQKKTSNMLINRFGGVMIKSLLLDAITWLGFFLSASK